jgi:hypothetical protein
MASYAAVLIGPTDEPAAQRGFLDFPGVTGARPGDDRPGILEAGDAAAAGGMISSAVVVQPGARSTKATATSPGWRPGGHHSHC